MKGKKQKEEIKKIIALPNGTVEKIEELAKSRRMSVKAYMEYIIIQHGNDNTPDQDK